ncbi:alpha/beta hydrolase-fold protein [Rhodocytophaga aerolata]|uniref:Alpha/beta hydrolase-fold protein n=1 Tax=Rhodocytophaga aerolata TaxID=455078 RepID=A0ABT8R3X9_9BACT|nr:alpha/beta hydrolase-fold protein [Rhodocytophaga aerolata]MDO1445452.1 alpha/beta hydrolase-fold protein [Rhodocytophaga aerolata]
MKFFYTVFLVTLLSSTISSFAARVDTLNIPSTAMKKNYRAAIVLPDSYAKSKGTYPVLYLLHGGGGQFSDWLKQTPDKQLLHKLADQYNLIIVTPEGEKLGGYLDSPFQKDNLFETYITKEVITKIDDTYRTIRSRNGRVITGLSMGGHGALYLATRNPDLFCAAGSMSGALDLNPANWRIDPEFAERIKPGFERILGPQGGKPDQYAAHSVVNMADQIKANDVKLIIDCGVDDFLIEPNRELHRRLVYNKVTHDYTERPGGHTWDYWENSLPYHVLFFNKILKSNSVVIP